MKDAKQPSLYDLLGVARGASQEEIENAYRTAAAMYGPGSFASYSLLREAEREETFGKIEEAFRTLSDPDKRRSYNRSIKVPAIQLVRRRKPEAEKPTQEPDVPKTIWQRVHLPLRGRQGADDAESGPELVEPQEPLFGQEYSLSTGQYLKHVRQTKGISLSGVSDATKIGVQYLEALEDGDYQKLPRGSYLTYIIAAYAKALNLDAKSVVSDFRARNVENRTSSTSSQPPGGQH